jgi:ATP-binding cassette, subfamily B, bacterial PglK
MILLFMIGSVIDVIGISFIGLYLSLILNNGASEGILAQFIIWTGILIENNYLIFIGVGLLILFLFKAITASLINFIILRFCMNIRVSLQSILMQSYQSMPYSEYISKNSSEYIYTVQSLANLFSGGILVNILKIISESIVGILIFIFLAYTNTKLLIVFGCTLLFLIIIYDLLFKKKLIIYGKLSNNSATSLVQGINEGIAGLKEIRVLNCENYFHNNIVTSSKLNVKYNIRYQVLSFSPRVIFELVIVYLLVIVVIIYSYQEQNLKLIIPTLSVFAIAALRLLPIISTLATGFTQLRFNIDTVSKLYNSFTQLDLMNVRSDKNNNLVSKITFPIKSTASGDEKFKILELNNISYTYPNSSIPSLRNISLKILAGESIGLIGPSGAGKTTLIDIILGLLEPQKGTVLFNGEPLNEKISIWYSHAAYLPQRIFIIDNTLKRNVALGKEDDNIDNIRLKEALRKSKLTELLAELPDGLNTVLGERGERLSGGQIQRVALARAFYHGRSVIVIDEGTNALDKDLEKEIIDEIQNLKGKITLIIISHNMSTVQHCDRIYKLVSGNLVDDEPPREHTLDVIDEIKLNKLEK